MFCGSNLDEMLFVPVCVIDPADMESTVLKYPSFGEVEELGGPGPSIDALYAQVSKLSSHHTLLFCDVILSSFPS